MIMTKTTKFMGATVSLALLMAAPASAHHSGAVFDQTRRVTFKGVVKSFEWANPHTRILLVTDADAVVGGGISYLIETTSPGNLTRNGWAKHARSLSPGDHLEVKLAPSKDGSAFGNLDTLTNLATGEVLTRKF